MSESLKNKKANLSSSLGMMLGATVGIVLGNVGLGMLVGLTAGILYEDYKKKKSKQNQL